MSERPFTCAVAVREADRQPFTLASVARSVDGDVYVNRPQPGVPGWNPHSSYRASGQHHHKSLRRAAMKAMREPPDGTFAGAVNVVTPSE